MRIGIDIDGVIADSLAHWIEHLNEHFEQDKKIEDMVFYQFEKVYGVPWRDMDRFFRDNQEKLLIGLSPIRDARETIIRLKQEHTILLITARPEEYEQTTMDWLAEHDICYHELLMTNFQDKREYCLKTGVDLFIDDSLDNALSIAELGIPVILFDAPYNQSELPPGIRRMNNWADIYDAIKAGFLATKQK